MTTGHPDNRGQGRGLSRGIKAAWVLVLGMLLAAAAWSLAGQLHTWGMPWPLAIALSMMFDAAGLICATYARRAVERGTPAGLSRAATLAFVSVAGVLNWNHGLDLGGRPAAVGFASLSAGVELLFELHRRDVRDEQRTARGLIAERLPHIPAIGWVMYPGRSWQTLRAAVGVRLELLDPVQTGQATDHPETIAPGPRPDIPPAQPIGPEGTVVEDVAEIYGPAHAPIVYFLRNGSRVKIGTSQNLKRRINTLCLRAEDLLFALHGDQHTERGLHERFAEQRVTNTEWFEITGALADFIVEKTGQPLPASPDAAVAQHDAPGDAGHASPDAPQVETIPRIGPNVTKTAAILAASAALQPDASPASIAQLLAQQGLAVDTAYIRTVLSREKQKPGKAGTEGYL